MSDPMISDRNDLLVLILAYVELLVLGRDLYGSGWLTGSKRISKNLNILRMDEHIMLTRFKE